jgi:hypothetical protein
MTRKYKRHLAGLGLGMTLSVAWTVFLGFALNGCCRSLTKCGAVT